MESSAITITLVGRPLGQPGGRFVLFADAANLVYPGAGFHHPLTGQMSLASELIKPGFWPYLMPIIMLFCSNLFMTFAWYGHLKFKVVPLAVVVLVSWGIALVEYCFAVPANRIGSAVYSPAELRRSRRWSRLSC